ncbi:unnamed protein product, partial [Urochloa humidicola]
WGHPHPPRLTCPILVPAEVGRLRLDLALPEAGAVRLHQRLRFARALGTLAAAAGTLHSSCPRWTGPPIYLCL